MSKLLIFGKIESGEIVACKGICMQCKEIELVDHLTGLCERCKKANEWDDVRGEFGGKDDA